MGNIFNSVASKKHWKPSCSNVLPFQFAPSGDVSIGIAPTLEVVIEGELTFNTAVKSLADELWAKKISEKPNIFDGPVWSLASYTCVETAECLSITLFLRSTSYRYKMLQRDVALSKYNVDGETLQMLSTMNPIGVGAVVLTKDDKVCLGKRSHATPIAPGMWCYPGGVLDAPDPHAVIMRELHEELGLRPDHIGLTEFVGMWDTGELHAWIPALFYGVCLKVSAEEIEQELWPQASDKAEHTALAFIDAAAPIKACARLEEESGAKLIPLCHAVVESYASAVLKWAHQISNNDTQDNCHS